MWDFWDLHLGSYSDWRSTGGVGGVGWDWANSASEVLIKRRAVISPSVQIDCTEGVKYSQDFVEVHINS